MNGKLHFIEELPPGRFVVLSHRPVNGLLHARRQAHHGVQDLAYGIANRLQVRGQILVHHPFPGPFRQVLQPLTGVCQVRRQIHLQPFARDEGHLFLTPHEQIVNLHRRLPLHPHTTGRRVAVIQKRIT